MNSRQTELAAQFLQFSVLGLVGTAVQYGILALGVGQFKADPVVSSTIGFVAGAIANFFLAHFLIFSNTLPIWNTAWRFGVVVSVGMVLNAAIMYWLVTDVKLHYFLAQVLSTGAVLIWNFAGNKWWSFR